MGSLRLTVRALARTPVVSAMAILSLALGIGANTAIFSLLDQVVLHTLPVKNPEELNYLYHPGPAQGSSWTDEAGGPSFSYPMFRELQKEQTPFTALAGAQAVAVSLSYNNQAVPGSARLVSGNYFDLLGVRPALGRLIGGGDDRALGEHPVVVLGYGYWTSRFGNDIAVLNQNLVINGYPMTVVGVAEKGFTSERRGSTPDIFLPITMKKEVTPDWDGLRDRKNYWVTLVGRRKPRVTREQAEAAINVAYRRQLEQDVHLLKSANEDFLRRFRAKKIILKPGEYGRGGLNEAGRRPLLLLVGMAGLVLLIACANVANLQLARAAAAAREVAIRLAMGASRLQLIRQLLAESCALALSGGALGLLAAHWTLRLILAGIPPSQNIGLVADLNSRLLMFCFGLSVGTGILFGLFPALQATKADVVSSLRAQSGQSTAAGSARVFRKSLVTAQVAISLLLLISAGLFGQTLINLSRIELGIRVDHLLTFSLAPKLNRYTDERIASFCRQLTERLAAIPGVQRVSVARNPAIAGSSSSRTLSVEGYVPQVDDTSGLGAVNSYYNEVGPDYFRTLGIPLLCGREFTAADTLSSPKVAVVNEAFVRHYLPNQNPLGLHMGTGGSNAKLDIQIVGVVKDAKYSSMRETPPRVFYTPYYQSPRLSNVILYARTALEPERLAPLVQNEVAALDAQLPIRGLKTMEQQIEESIFRERLLSLLTVSFAGLAVVLAAVGLYGVLAFDVARRTREIGIRMALGAAAGHVRGLVVRQVALMLAVGTAAGVAAAAAACRLVQTMLYGLQFWDPFVYAAAAVVLWLVALAAAYVPARRATRVDPNIALRYE